MVKVFRFDESQKELSANTYVIGKIGGSCLVIDPGTKSNELYQYIEQHYEKINAILLTHAHFDHIRGIPDFLKHFKTKNVPIYLHPLDKPLLNNPVSNFSTMIGENVVVNIETIDIQDEEILEFKDYQVKVIHTPYHTEGSVCYLVEDDNCLFTGDSLFKGSIGRYDCATSDPNKIDSSLEKLLTLSNYLTVYPGHGEMTRLGNEKENNPYLARLRK